LGGSERGGERRRRERKTGLPVEGGCSGGQEERCTWGHHPKREITLYTDQKKRKKKTVEDSQHIKTHNRGNEKKGKLTGEWKVGVSCQEGGRKKKGKRGEKTGQGSPKSHNFTPPDERKKEVQKEGKMSG